MKRRAFLALTGAGVSTSLAGCFDGQAAATDENRITMTQVAFRPDELTVSVGTTVVFDNTSSHGHTVTASGIPDEAEYFASGGYDSYEAAREGWENDNGGVLTQGDVFEHEFTTPGSHNYVCLPHLDAGMEGIIHVEEESAAETEQNTSG